MTDNEMKCAKYILGLLMLAGCSRLEQPQGPAIVCQAEAPEQAQSPANEQTKGAGVVMTYSVTIDLIGHYSVEADITYDSNAGAFLGGSFQVNDTRAGAYGTDGMGVGGSSAGQFITD